MLKRFSNLCLRRFSTAGWGGFIAGILCGIPLFLYSEAYADALDTNASLNASSSELNLTLDEAIKLALERNRGLLNQRLTEENNRLDREEVEERYRPRFTLSSNATRTRGEAASNDDTATVSFGADLEIPTGGEFNFSVEESIGGEQSGNPSLGFRQRLLSSSLIDRERNSLAEERIEEQKKVLTFQKSMSDIVVNTISEYRSLIQAFRQLDIAKTSLQRAIEQQEVTRAMIQVGRVARREATRSEATIANRELALLTAENTLNEANIKLINSLDLDSTTRIYPQESFQFDQIRKVEIGQIDIQESIEIALQKRTDYRMEKLNLESARITVRNKEKSKLPGLDFSFTVTRDRSRKRNQNTASLTLNIPLNNRSIDRDIIKSKNRLIMSERNLEGQREAIGNSVRQAVKSVELRYRSTLLARQARELAEQNLAIEQNKFNQGLSSTFEVTASEDDLVSAENAEIDAIISYLRALITLDQEMGLTLETWNIDVEEVLE